MAAKLALANTCAKLQKTVALKDGPSPKYVSRGRNVPSEIQQKYHVFHLFKSCWLRLLLDLPLLLPLLLLPAACCLLPAACCLLPAACCLLPAACCLLPAACCLLASANACETLAGSKTSWPLKGEPSPGGTSLLTSYKNVFFTTFHLFKSHWLLLAGC